MDPIGPIGPSVPELPAVQPVWREGERQKDREQKGREQKSREEDPPEEDDGRPHIDVIGLDLKPQLTAPNTQGVAPNLFWLGGYDEATGLADEIRGFLRALEARGH